jgi:hypothetical protein
MKPRRHLCIALCLLGLGLLAQPGSAGAAVTFGADLSQIPGPGDNCVDCAAFTLKTTSGTVETGSPVDGTLVSARIRTRFEGGIGSFRVLHPTGTPGVYLNVGQAPVVVTADSSSTGHITEVLTHIPIAVGDRLAVSFPDQNLHYLKQGASALCMIRAEPPVQAVGTTGVYTTAGCAGFEVLVAGTVDPVPAAQPDNSFALGPAQSLKSGKAKLPVRVPGAGVVTAGDAAFASATSARKRKPLIKSASATAAAAGTITLTLKPTSAGRKILAHKNKLRVSVQVTFTPTGGTAASQQTQITLKKKKG